ncbi:MAG TPA: WYL domain-containing protein [Candidatus Nanopelagicaceae bacterium]|jgi:proteasome accessory factor C
MSKPVPSSGLERTERLLDLVPYLATHQGIALDDLAREFSLTTAQLTEDLTTLWMCGLPGYTPLELMDLSFDTGVVTISNADTLAKPRALNRDEILALVLGLETLQEETDLGHTDLTETISKLVSKLINLVDPHVQQKVQAGTSALSNVRAQLELAIKRRSGVEISYHSISRDEVTRRVIHPLEFSTSKGHDYVLAFCELSNGYRTFRLDRILTAAAVPNPQSAQVREMSGSEDGRLSLTLRIHSRMRDVVEGFNVDHAPSHADSSPRVQVSSFSADWAIRQIMSLGGEVGLEAPREFRTQLQERAARALSAYRS